MGEAKRRAEHDERRQMRGTCQTCEHFAALEKECREDSRKASLMMGPNGPGVFGYWPGTEPHFWCGKHKPDVNSASRVAAPANVFAHLSSNGNA